MTERLERVACALCVTSPLMVRSAEGLWCRACGSRVEPAVVEEAWLEAVQGLDLVGGPVLELIREAVPGADGGQFEPARLLDPGLMDLLCREVAWGAGELVVRWRYPFDLVAEAQHTPRPRELLREWLAGLDGEVVDGLLQLLVSARRQRRTRRRPLGPCNVLTIPEALAELGMGDQDGLAWLHAEGLIHRPGRDRRGAGRVLAADLAEAIRREGNAPKPKKAPTRLPMKRTDRF